MGEWREGRARKVYKGKKEKDRDTQKRNLRAGVRQQIGRRHNAREIWPGSKREI